LESRRTRRFRRLQEDLPNEVQEQARATYRLRKANPAHPGLDFKRIEGTAEPVWSIRVGLHWRALARVDGDRAVWFWIGSHAEYDRLLKRI
jgi:hypothetical protein